jgi:hypothetical protein
MGHPPVPRFGFALCLPFRIGYVDDSRTVTGFYFHTSGLFLGKHLLRLCACGVANLWFMSWLRMWRRRKDAFFNCQRAVIKDRERHCLLIALIVRRRREIICKDLPSRRMRLARQCSMVSGQFSILLSSLGGPGLDFQTWESCLCVSENKEL